MSQVGRTRCFARSARRGEEKNQAFLVPSSRASHEISRSPRLPHKALVMQAIRVDCVANYGGYFGNYSNCP